MIVVLRYSMVLKDAARRFKARGTEHLRRMKQAFEVQYDYFAGQVWPLLIGFVE